MKLIQILSINILFYPMF